MDDADKVLRRTTELATEYLHSLRDRDVGPHIDAATLVKALGGDLPDEGVDPVTVVEDLVAAVEPGLFATAGPRFFGFVIGGSLPVALATDWLTSTWDQNNGMYVVAPAASVVEDVAASWLLDVLGLPSTASVGYVTGATMANFTGLAAARHKVLAGAGWDVESDGLSGAPPVRILAGKERHATLDSALRYLGFGNSNVELIDVDDQGRMRADELRRHLGEHRGVPLIVCAQAGNVNTGGIDPVGEICDLTHEHGGWVHVDGAFGLWAGASPAYRHLVEGVDRADSWATDAHKWLNVPYDSGLAIVADPAAHAAAMGLTASYFVVGAEGERDAFNLVPETSRRARGFPIYAALRSLGRRGVADLVERCCAHAKRFADELATHDGVEILNEVVLNQVLVRFDDSDEMTRAVFEGLQRDGTSWFGGTTWQGRGAMRISVSNWSTTEDDVDRSLGAILRCYRDAHGR